jgi:hypothetical protein
VVDIEDLHLAALVVDSIPDAVLPATRTPQTFKRGM